MLVIYINEWDHIALNGSSLSFNLRSHFPKAAALHMELKAFFNEFFSHYHSSLFLCEVQVRYLDILNINRFSL